MYVCMCVCVFVREREREREMQLPTQGCDCIVHTCMVFCVG